MAVLLFLVAAVVALCVYVSEYDSRVHGMQTSPEETAKALTPAAAGEPFYTLILGSDTRSTLDQAKSQRADIIILARVDTSSNQVTLVSIPRDTRWEHEGSVYKINEAYNIGGAALEIKAVAELTGVPISHVFEIDQWGFTAIINNLGGVKVTVPQDISYKDSLGGNIIYLKEGEQVLGGREALIFARVRSQYQDSDATRQSNVRQLFSAMVDAIREKPFFEWPAIGLSIASCYGSDTNLLDLLLVMSAFGDGAITMYSGTGPNLGDIDESANGQWLCYDNPEGWARVMEAVEAGGNPSDVDPNLEYEGLGATNEDLEDIG